MLTSDQEDKLVFQWNSLNIAKKTEVFNEFLKEYGENASWEEWITFLQERPELEGFQWARSLSDISSC